MTSEFLSWEEIKFLANFRCLTEDQQAIIEWQIKNIDLLKKLIPVDHISISELNEVMESARQRDDNWMIALTAHAISRKQSAEQP